MTNQPHVAIIIGASRGIGHATAQELAARGSHTILAARDRTALERLATHLQSTGAHATPIACDITSETDIRHLIAHATAITGQIDLLVNSAGTAIVAPFEELTLNDWETTLRTGLTGTFLTCKYASPAMRPGALIVNIASIAARQAFPQWAAYNAAKYGVLGLSNAIREELRPRGIRVTVVLPAATDTTIWDTIPGTWNRSNMLHPADIARAIAHLIDQPPYATTEELVIGHVSGRL